MKNDARGAGMKAVEFVKKFGWDHAKTHVVMLEDVQIGNNNQEYIDNLKRLVESHELVSEFDDIEQAKAWIPAMDSDMPYNVRGSKRRFMRDELAQAIRDVESVGVGCEGSHRL